MIMTIYQLLCQFTYLAHVKSAEVVLQDAAAAAGGYSVTQVHVHSEP